MLLDKFEKQIDRIRYISLIAVLASALGSLLMFLVGANKVWLAYSAYAASLLEGMPPGEAGNLAIAFVVQAIDAFLIALVLLIFGLGVYSLFVHELKADRPETRSWTGIRSISQLKTILAELVIIILMVKFLESALRSTGSYEWELLLLPAGVLMLAGAVKLLGLKDG